MKVINLPYFYDQQDDGNHCRVQIEHDHCIHSTISQSDTGPQSMGDTYRATWLSWSHQLSLSCISHAELEPLLHKQILHMQTQVFVSMAFWVEKHREQQERMATVWQFLSKSTRETILRVVQTWEGPLNDVWNHPTWFLQRQESDVLETLLGHQPKWLSEYGLQKTGYKSIGCMMISFPPPSLYRLAAPGTELTTRYTSLLASFSFEDFPLCFKQYESLRWARIRYKRPVIHPLLFTVSILYY